MVSSSGPLHRPAHYTFECVSAHARMYMYTYMRRHNDACKQHNFQHSVQIEHTQTYEARAHTDIQTQMSSCAVN